MILRLRLKGVVIMSNCQCGRKIKGDDNRTQCYPCAKAADALIANPNSHNTDYCMCCGANIHPSDGGYCDRC